MSDGWAGASTAHTGPSSAHQIRQRKPPVQHRRAVNHHPRVSKHFGAIPGGDNFFFPLILEYLALMCYYSQSLFRHSSAFTRFLNRLYVKDPSPFCPVLSPSIKCKYVQRVSDGAFCFVVTHGVSVIIPHRAECREDITTSDKFSFLCHLFSHTKSIKSHN